MLYAKLIVILLFVLFSLNESVADKPSKRPLECHNCAGIGSKSLKDCQDYGKFALPAVFAQYENYKTTPRMVDHPDVCLKRTISLYIGDQKFYIVLRYGGMREDIKRSSGYILEDGKCNATHDGAVNTEICSCSGNHCNGQNHFSPIRILSGFLSIICVQIFSQYFI